MNLLARLIQLKNRETETHNDRFTQFETFFVPYASNKHKQVT
jgi:hypothetical protein